MDATVVSYLLTISRSSSDHLISTQHVFYEVAGTAGAFASSSAISKFGNNYSFFLTPIFFCIAGSIWVFISLPHDSSVGGVGLEDIDKDSNRGNYLVQTYRGFVGFGKSVWVGFLVIFGSRKFICKPPFVLHFCRTIAQSFCRATPRLRDGSLSPQILGVHPRPCLRQAYSRYQCLGSDYRWRFQLW